MEQDPKKLTRAHKIALGIISAVCCCVIGISAFALVAPDALSEQPAQQSEQADARSDSDQASDDTASEDQSDPNANSNSAEQAANTSSDGDSSAAAGNSSNQGKSDNSKSNSSSNGNKSSGSNSNGSGSASSKDSNGSSSSANQGSAAKGDTITVSVSVSSSAADGRVSGSAHPTFKKGATAYDALCATGLSVSTKSSQYGLYVSAIGGLAEFEYGGKSGWMYSVNGSTPNVSCGKYRLKDGDTVSWFYVK